MNRGFLCAVLLSTALTGQLGLLSAQSASTPVTFTYTYSGYALPLPGDSANTAALMTITVPRAINVSKVVAGVKVDYPSVGDLNIYLFGPDGTRTKLIERNCGSLVNVDTTFDDAAQSAYGDFCPSEAGRGPFRGNEPLSNFNGRSSLGTWTLAVENNGSDTRTGSVVGFSLTISGMTVTSAAIAPDGIRNSAAPLASGAPIAPGETITIVGVNLGPQNAITSTSDWPTWVDGTAVRINGQDAPLRYVGLNRIDAAVPMGLDLTKNAKVQVYRNAAVSNEVEVPVSTTSPGVFSVNLVGTGQAAAINSDGTLNSATNPAARGSEITLAVNGLGITDPRSAEGSVTPPGVSLVPVAPVTALVGGAQAQVRRASLIPGQVGVFAVQVMVPLSVRTASAEVIVSAGDFSSQKGVVVYLK